jgi:hypothetical protein
MAIGDGLCDPISMTNYGDYLYEVGMIGYKERRHFKEMEKGARENIQQGNWRIAGEASTIQAHSSTIISVTSAEQLQGSSASLLLGFVF